VVVALQIQLSQYGDSSRGATTAEKLKGTKVWVPTPGRARPKAGLDVGCGRGSPSPAVRVREYHPGKFFENSDAKSCVLVPAMLISGFPRTLLVPRPESWGTSLPRSLRLLSLAPMDSSTGRRWVKTGDSGPWRGICSTECIKA